MNKKVTTYILLSFFMAIWLIVGYSIYKYMHKEESNNNISNTQFSTNQKNDTFSLLLNYNDPFIGKVMVVDNSNKENSVKPKITKNNTIDNSIKPKIVESVKPLLVPINVQYEGTIDNTTAKKKVAIIKINNVEYLLKEGDVEQNIKLLSISNDFITISRNGAKSEKITK